MSAEYCGNCKHRPGGCAFSPDPELKIMPNYHEPCVFTPSRFERKPDPHGRVISPMQEPSRAPMVAEIRSGPPPDTGYSMVCRAAPSGLGATQFLIRDGKCFNVETKEYICDLADMDGPQPTPEQLDEAWKQLKSRFNL